MAFFRAGGVGAQRFFAAKAVLLMTGAGLGIAGMLSETDLLVWIAMVLIAAGLLLRLLGRRREEQP